MKKFYILVILLSMGITQIYAQCYQCTGTNNTGFSIGTGVATGNNSFAGGSFSTASGINSFAFGDGSTVNALRGIALGNNANVSLTDGIAIGSFATSNAANSYLFGQNLFSNAANSITIGLGSSSSKLLSNSKPGSIMFGVTQIPSLTIVQPTNGDDVGYLGIGTEEPEQKVHINEGNLLISSVNSGSTNDPVGALLFDDFSTSPWCIEYPGSSGLNFRQYNPFTFPGAENSVLFLSNYQRVGIGTRSPQQKLHVKNGNLLITGPSKSTGIEENAIIFKLEDVVMPSPAPSRWGIERIELGGRNCGLNFWKYGKTKIGAEYRSVMFFNDNDFVGIGTENPQTKLDIAGDFRAESAEITGTLTADELSVQNINIGEKLGIGVTGTLLTNLQIGNIWTFQDANGGKTIGRNTYFNGTNDVRIKQGVASRIRFEDATGHLVLQTAKPGGIGSIIETADWNLLCLTNSGNVGVGTRSPHSKLDVDGSFRAQSTFIKANTISVPFTEMQIGALWTFQDLSDQNIIGRNNYIKNGTDTRISLGFASRMVFNNSGDILLQTTPKGSAGTIPEWNTVTLANNGNVGIGTIAAPQTKLEVGGSFKATSANITDKLTAKNATIADTTKTNILNAQTAIIDGKLTAQTIELKHKLTAKNANIDTLTGKILNFKTANIEEKLGIGVSGTLHTNFQIGNIWTFQDVSNNHNIGKNTYTVGANDVRIQAGAASRISFNNSGGLFLQTTSTDAPGSTIRWNTVTLDNFGNMGIGTSVSQPLTAKLEINGLLKAQSAEIVDKLTAKNASITDTTSTKILKTQTANIADKLTAKNASITDTTSTKILKAQTANITGRITANDMRIDNLLCAREVKVQLATCWPDYVFNKEYNLMPLNKVEAFITENQHLPNVPSAAEVEANGVNVGEMNATLLKKVEELTLYIINLQKQIDELKNAKP